MCSPRWRHRSELTNPMRVVTKDLVESQNKYFGRNPSCSYVKPVVTRGPTVLDIDTTGQLLTIIICIRQIIEKMRVQRSIASAIYVLQQVCNSVPREVLYNIVIAFGIPTKLVCHIKLCLNKPHSRVRVGKHQSDVFSIRNL
jgi:hypothetical protein